MSPRVRYSFFIDPELAEGLKRLKAKTGIPESEAVRRAIAGYLVREGLRGPKKAAARRGGARKTERR
jgi:hypothetical protein